MIREFEKYKYLGVATARKYYSHYFMKWEEDVIQTAYLGVYKALMKIDTKKVKDEVSIKSFITYRVRAEIKNWEVGLFGTKDSKRREMEYNMLSMEYEIRSNNSGHKEEQKEFLVDDYSEEMLIRDIAIKSAYDKLDDIEKDIVRCLMTGGKVINVARNRGINKDKIQRMKKKVLKKLSIELKNFSNSY
jgi:RNA polymerase sigma factor (sigma-70 family)